MSIRTHLGLLALTLATLVPVGLAEKASATINTWCNGHNRFYASSESHYFTVPVFTFANSQFEDSQPGFIQGNNVYVRICRVPNRADRYSLTKAEMCLTALEDAESEVFEYVRTRFVVKTKTSKWRGDKTVTIHFPKDWEAGERRCKTEWFNARWWRMTEDPRWWSHSDEVNSGGRRDKHWTTDIKHLKPAAMHEID